MSDPLHIADPMVKCEKCGETHSSFFRCQERQVALNTPLMVSASTSTPFQSDIKILTIAEYNAILLDIAAIKMWKQQQEAGK